MARARLIADLHWTPIFSPSVQQLPHTSLKRCLSGPKKDEWRTGCTPSFLIIFHTSSSSIFCFSDCIDRLAPLFPCERNSLEVILECNTPAASRIQLEEERSITGHLLRQTWPCADVRVSWSGRHAIPRSSPEAHIADSFCLFGLIRSPLTEST